jgi:hypothetical protein
VACAVQRTTDRLDRSSVRHHQCPATTRTTTATTSLRNGFDGSNGCSSVGCGVKQRTVVAAASCRIPGPSRTKCTSDVQHWGTRTAKPDCCFYRTCSANCTIGTSHANCRAGTSCCSNRC